MILLIKRVAICVELKKTMQTSCFQSMLAFCLIIDVFKHTIEFILDVLFSLLLLS